MKNYFAKILQPLMLFLICYNPLWAQVYMLDASHVVPKAIQPIDMHGTDPSGNTLAVNNSWFERNGKPWFPLMGEMHYNRVPPQDWENGILKMKSAGLSIVATYVFWNEHETAPGVWDWKYNRDLRKFVELCARHSMYVWLRIGPWVHGEQLHGGHPDWIAKMKGRRTNEPAYIAASTKLFNQIGVQTHGLFFNQGGPIIGIQLENEYASGQAAHITKLKQMAQEAGIQPVFWSVTANTVFDERKMEVIPLQGSYCYRGWEKAGGAPTNDFLYGDDQWIMTGALGKLFYDVNRFPRGLCEQGAGSQMMYLNRFVVEPYVEEAHLQNQIGRGMNLIGYYMFHGGTQTPGLKEPGLPESYDFQAPVGEYGIIRQSYRNLKILHQFINSFGTELVQMQPVEPSNPVRDVYDTAHLRYIARVKDNSGFLFLCNTQVRIPMPDKSVTMQVKLQNETIQFPEINLKGQTTLILPFNIVVNDIRIKYATAQILTKIENKDETTLFFIKPEGIDPEIAMDYSTIAKNDSSKELTTIARLSPNTPVHFTAASGKKLTVILLSRQEAEQSLYTTINGKNVLLISNADLIVDNSSLQMERSRPDFTLKAYPAGTLSFAGNNDFFKQKSNAGFDIFNASVNAYTPGIKKRSISKKEVELSLPGKMPANVSDIILKINYLGASCDVLQNEKIISDNLMNGLPWMISANRFLKEPFLKLCIRDWNDSITGVDPELLKEIKARGSTFTNIEAIPKYSLKFSVE